MNTNKCKKRHFPVNGVSPRQHVAAAAACPLIV